MSNIEDSFDRHITSISIFFIIAIILFFTMAAGYKIGKRYMKKQAIDNGVGRYEVDDDGKVEFKWNKSEKAEKALIGNEMYIESSE